MRAREWSAVMLAGTPIRAEGISTISTWAWHDSAQTRGDFFSIETHYNVTEFFQFDVTLAIVRQIDRHRTTYFRFARGTLKKSRGGESDGKQNDVD